MKSKKCKNCECDSPVWSKGYCKNHTPQKPLKRVSTIEKMKPYQDKMNKTFQMHTFFMQIWHDRPRKSEVSGTYLGNEALSIYFHHILPKSKYEQAAFDEENIILMTMDEHNSVENDMYKYEEVNERREALLKKYDLI